MTVRMNEGVSRAAADAVRVEENKIMNSCGDGIVCEYPETTCSITKNTIYMAEKNGIWVKNGACPVIRENEVVLSKGDGIGTWHNGTKPVITSNTLKKNKGSGITIAKGASPLIKDNDIVENDRVGVWVRHGSSGKIELNRFADNSSGPVKAVTGCDFTMKNNKGRLFARCKKPMAFFFLLFVCGA